MPQVMPVEKSKNDTFFVLVTRVFWRRCFVCGGKLFKNAYSCEQNENGNNDKNQLTITLARTLAFGNTLVAITHAFPKKFSLSYDCEDATANACKQKHLSQIANKKYIKSPQGTIRPPKRNKIASHLDLQSSPKIFLWISNLQ